MVCKVTGKYQRTSNKEGRKFLQAIAVIDPAMGLIEITSIPIARADLYIIQVEVVCLIRYPLRNKIIVDTDKELFAEF